MTSGIEVLQAEAKGLKVGAKAVTNSALNTAVSTVTLGQVDGKDYIPVTDEDRAMGYNASAAISRVGEEILVGVAAGGAATALSKGGKIAKLGGYALRALDVTQNSINIGTGAADAAENGLDWQNGAQIVGGTLGNLGALNGIGKGQKIEIDPNKFKYIFGEVTSGTHNTQRSLENAAQMNRIGIHNTAQGQRQLSQHLQGVAQDPSSVARTFQKTLPDGNTIAFQMG